VPRGRAEFKEPVYIEDGVTLKDATIGPNVAVEAAAASRGARRQQASSARASK